MRIIVTGATGLIGSALSSYLRKEGHRVNRLVRGRPSSGSEEIFWDPDKGNIDAPSLEGADVVVHLAGENVGRGRWTQKRKKAILQSRVEGTRLLCEALAGLKKPPGVLISASAVGYYGPGGERFFDEEAPPGKSFLGEVCRRWEAATAPAAESGIRVVVPRIGIVLSARGGALAKMLMPFKLGLGGRVGQGSQYMSWIAIDDMVGVLYHMISNNLSGPVNAVAPNPVTQIEFARTLGGVMNRPAFFPTPAFLVKLIFGEMGRALLLEGARVDCTRLRASGYAFCRPSLEDALRSICGL